MKNQALFSSKDKSKKLKYRLLQFMFCALRVNNIISQHLKLQLVAFLKIHLANVYFISILYQTSILHSHLSK